MQLLEAEIALKLLELLLSPAIVSSSIVCMVKVVESKQLATSFLQPLLGKKEPARAHCGLSVVCDADASTWFRSCFFTSYHSMYKAKARDKINSKHKRATFAAACIVLATILGEPLSCSNTSADGACRTLAEGCTSKLWDQSTLPYLQNHHANNIVTRVSMLTSLSPSPHSCISMREV